MRCGLVIPAAGQAERLGGVDKTLVELGGHPALHWVLDAFASTGKIAEVSIAVSEHNRSGVEAVARSFSERFRLRVVGGGETRADSVSNAVRALSDPLDLIVIHDAARPLVTPELIRSVINAAREHGAAIAALPVTDTIKRVRDGLIVETVDRSTLMGAQTPQAFRRDLLSDAYARADAESVATDESSLIERAGYTVRVVAGSPENLKITNPVDLLLAGLVLQQRGLAATP